MDPRYMGLAKTDTPKTDALRASGATAEEILDSHDLVERELKMVQDSLTVLENAHANLLQDMRALSARIGQQWTTGATMKQQFPTVTLDEMKACAERAVAELADPEALKAQLAEKQKEIGELVEALSDLMATRNALEGLSRVSVPLSDTEARRMAVHRARALLSKYEDK